ncbi:MAG: regulatory protein RecX [Tissierellia bacterium]|nr:regulatory protein RecX [Tissierellia bacterium]
MIQILAIDYREADGNFNVETSLGTFLLRYEQLEELGLSVEQELPDEAATILESFDAFNRGWKIATNYLSRQQRCSHEVSERLRQRGIGHEITQSILTQLQKLGLIDDRAYILAYVEDRFQYKKQSKRQIHYDLSRKKLPKEWIEEAFLPFQEEVELSNALELGMKKLGERSLKDQKERNRIYRYLLSKGFDYDVVNQVMERLDR